jgi:phage antirepressor YoqD-like protein
MYNLSIAQNELTMSSREIAELTGARHVDVIRSIDRLAGKNVVKGYAPVAYTSKQNNQSYNEYLLIKRDSLIVVAQLMPEFTAAIVDRWQELENRLPALPDFNNPAAAARAWADAKDAENNAQLIIEQQQPAVDFVNRYTQSTGLKGVREVAKILKANEREFTGFLVEQKIMYRLAGKLTGYQNHIDAGRFQNYTGEAHGHSFTSSKFTGKGVEWVAGQWADNFYDNRG